MIQTTSFLSVQALIWLGIVTTFVFIFVNGLIQPKTKFKMQERKTNFIRKRAIVHRYYFFKLFLLATIFEGNEKKHRFYIKRLFKKPPYKKIYSTNINFKKHEKIKQQPK